MSLAANISTESGAPLQSDAHRRPRTDRHGLGAALSRPQGRRFVPEGLLPSLSGRAAPGKLRSVGRMLLIVGEKLVEASVARAAWLNENYAVTDEARGRTEPQRLWAAGTGSIQTGLAVRPNP